VSGWYWGWDKEHNPMFTADNTARARRLVKACYHLGNFAIMDEVLAPDFGNHDLSASQVCKL